MKYLVLVLGFLAGSVISAGAQTNVDYKATGAAMPIFVLEKANGKMITNQTLQKNKPVVMMIFSPQCEHCEHTIDSLKTMTDRFARTQLVMITEARNQPELKGFLKKTGLDTARVFKNLGMDRSNLIPYIYTYQLLPQFNIYNAKHKLVKSFAGNFPLDSLRMYLH
jgi:spore coat protein CotF